MTNEEKARKFGELVNIMRENLPDDRTIFLGTCSVNPETPDMRTTHTAALGDLLDIPLIAVDILLRTYGGGSTTQRKAMEASLRAAIEQLDSALGKFSTWTPIIPKPQKLEIVK